MLQRKTVNLTALKTQDPEFLRQAAMLILRHLANRNAKLEDREMAEPDGVPGIEVWRELFRSRRIEFAAAYEILRTVADRINDGKLVRHSEHPRA